MNCWLVVWKREKLRVDEFFDAVADRKEDISVWLEGEDVREDDKGVIVVQKGKGKRRAIYATFTVTGAPEMRKDTHPEFWECEDAHEEKMRALVRFDPRFAPIEAIVSDPNLKMPPNSRGRWVRSIPMAAYDRVRACAAPVGD